MIKNHAWAKRDDFGTTLALIDHGEDVAAVLCAVLTQTAYRGRIEGLAGRVLSDQDIKRLCTLAFLHDFGKANSGFWRRQFPKMPRIGHTEVAGALFHHSIPLRNQAVVRELSDLIAAWGAAEHFTAVMAHHGRPLASFSTPGAMSGSSTREARRDAGWWRPIDGYDPLAELARLLSAARLRFPLAFVEGPPLPDAPRFVALLAGLTTLADWLGSDTAHFPLVTPFELSRSQFAARQAALGVTVRGLRPLSRAAPDSFIAAFGFPPYEAQEKAAAAWLGAISALEAETGSGKTEAALWRALGLIARGEVDGLYFAVPTRTAATQLHGRINRHLARIYGADAPRAVLAVPGYLRAGDEDGQRLAPFTVLWPDEEDNDARWAAEAPKRYLAARIAVGTIDQALMAGLQVKHAHLRAAALPRLLLVVDEVHASDTFQTEILKTVIGNHVAAGGRVMLLSATLGSAARAALLGREAPSLAQALETPYPALSGSDAAPRKVTTGGRRKEIAIETAPLIAHPREIAIRALAAARAGAAVLVVRNTVADAVAVQQALEAEDAGNLLFRVGSVATLHHGRFAAEDRRLLDTEIEALFGKVDGDQVPGERRGRERRPIVAVGTTTLEMSLDLDADLLITDLAPMDVLLQRFGRLHRHRRDRPAGFETVRAIVLVPEARDLSPLLDRARNGLGPFKEGRGIYPRLAVIEATWRLLEEHAWIVVPCDCRRLVELTTHPEALDAVAAQKGGAWLDHATRQEGGRVADMALAAHHRLDMAATFTDLSFPEDETVRTRLGADDRLIRPEVPFVGPFGVVVTQLRIPGWMLTKARPIPDDATVAVREEAGAEGVRFTLGTVEFRYDRLGLRVV
ncbi:CRISPR-associated helicase Cas3' [Methylobacterium sp. SyP6R]|uniref:CRISPR-associated helicase Cas3' n=1 Tax=Methylobacterium sp. SyP6R TaxID=2718876 RepID=UPI001F01386E|nr:CRISPR-associated helicase Cas3' [Methylobacterium sp. SyP6R]MCF4129605.1 CRISPR-associated helicase Cas3' [Methylobacterium sp. SyP6R]